MKRIRGFTLLELLLVLALVAAASLLAMAAFGGGMQGIRMRTAAHDVAAQHVRVDPVAVEQVGLRRPADAAGVAAVGRGHQRDQRGNVGFGRIAENDRLHA